MQSSTWVLPRRRHYMGCQGPPNRRPQVSLQKREQRAQSRTAWPVRHARRQPRGAPGQCGDAALVLRALDSLATSYHSAGQAVRCLRVATRSEFSEGYDRSLSDPYASELKRSVACITRANKMVRLRGQAAHFQHTEHGGTVPVRSHDTASTASYS